MHAGIYTPPGSRPPRADTHPEQTPPPGKQTPAYGQRAAGTHPTGMHSCLGKFRNVLFKNYLLLINECKFAVFLVFVFLFALLTAPSINNDKSMKSPL